MAPELLWSRDGGGGEEEMPHTLLEGEELQCKGVVATGVNLSHLSTPGSRVAGEGEQSLVVG